MTRSGWQRLYKTLITAAWALLFLSLPVTSFPFFPGEIGGKTLVRPLAVYPLIILVILVLIPRLFTKPLPRTFLPLLAFILVAMISSIAAYTLDIETLRGVSLTPRFIRNIATLAIGCAFYFTIVMINQDWSDLNFSLRWIYIGFGIALFWGSLQAIYILYYSEPYFELISKVQSLFSTRKLFETRVSGLTYEPKWFAEQIGFLLLPWLLGSVISGRTVFKWRFKWLTIEWLLLIWSAVIVLFTFSRTGLFLLAALSLITILLYRFRSPDRTHGEGENKPGAKNKRLIQVSLIVISIAIIGGMVGSQNRYISRFWRYWTEDPPGKKTYLEFIAFQQRFVYWQSAVNTFEEYPLLGVGLGNYAFFFDKMLPDQPYHRQPEIIRQITPVEGRNRLITPKNLYARLLAETGLLGMVTFTTFIMAVIGCTLYLLFSNSMVYKFWGISGLLGFVGFLVVIFSYDSFALPNMWVVFGMITAAAHVSDTKR